MSVIKSYRELDVYRNAIDAAMKVFQLSRAFPSEERYALTDQIRRSSRYVCANLAEARRKRRYEAAFIAKLSGAETEVVETQVWAEVAFRCGYWNEKTFQAIDEVDDQILTQFVRMSEQPRKWLLKFQQPQPWSHLALHPSSSSLLSAPRHAVIASRLSLGYTFRMKLPDQVAVMPLPNAILFPRVLLPLYIFEPRYKKMLADCLNGDRIFAVALLREGWERKGRNPPAYPVATVGLIRTCVARPDGTANLVLEGLTRVNICEYVKLHPYRVARVEELTSHEAAVTPARESLVAAVSKLAKARARLGAELPKPVLNSLLAVDSPDHLSDLVSYTLLENSHHKQLMLETLDVNQRLEKLVELLKKQIKQFELWKTLQGKLSNDNVGHN